MFKKLKFRINNLVILTFSLGLVLTGIVSYTLIRAILYDNFIDFSVKNMNQKINNTKIYSKFIEETSKQISANPTVILFLKNQNAAANIVNILDSVKQSHFGILGVALFDVSGTQYLSNYVTEYPQLDELKQNSTLGKLISSNQHSFWSVRSDDIAGYYENTRYYKDYGLITFASKIYDEENTLCGYLFVDIDPQYIYDFFKSSDRTFPKDTIVYIGDEKEGILPSKLKAPLDNELLGEISSGINTIEGYTISKDRKHILIYNSMYDSNQIIIIVPLAGLFLKLNNILAAMLSVIAILIAVSVSLGILLTNSISSPLIDLYGEMKSNTI